MPIDSSATRSIHVSHLRDAIRGIGLAVRITRIFQPLDSGICPDLLRRPVPQHYGIQPPPEPVSMHPSPPLNSACHPHPIQPRTASTWRRPLSMRNVSNGLTATTLKFWSMSGRVAISYPSGPGDQDAAMSLGWSPMPFSRRMRRLSAGEVASSGDAGG